ncbi:MAG: VOC family protein [Parvibaculum sp.]|uniref:VOC family protein n=1 Tax=Parvibaculum sp. TaxID=2024848 RepID=UPI0025D8EDFC|nr:VOC family protein [Parvibaculum sp.]MCE9649704.1 VOC family protein [Parvibaculum sp.]
MDRIVLAVRDLASAESIYTRMLGRTPSGRREDRSGGTERLLYRLSNMTLELVSVFGSGSWSSIVASRLDMGGEGLLALFLRTDGVVAAAETLKARGLPAVVLAENEGHDKGGRVRRWRNALIPPEASRELMIVINEVLGDPDDLKPAPLREGVTEAEAISELDHVVVMTRDAEACKRFFGDQLGIRLALDHSKPEWGVRQLFFRLGGVTIEVVQSLDETKVPEKDFLWGLAWKASNVATVAARLAREGADVSEVRIGRKKGTEVATIRKPTCGVPTLLVGPIAAES